MRNYDIEADRAEKRIAYGMAFKEFKPLEMFSCVLLMPSVTCLDIDMLKSHFWSGTKLVCVENFEYIHCSEREWREAVMSHLPSCIDRGNVYFHRGELEDLQLGAVLRMLGEECVDFAFFDLCGEMTLKQYRWVWNNRSLFKKCCPVLYTIDLQPSIIKGCSGFDMRMEHDRNYEDGTFVYFVNESDHLTKRVRQSALCWSFILKHILNPSQMGVCSSIIYRSGGDKHKMMLVKTKNYFIDAYEYRHDYYEGFFRKSSTTDGSLVRYDGIDWGDYGCRDARNDRYEIRSNDVLLFQNKEIRDCWFDYGRFLDYFFNGTGRRKPANDRRFQKDRILNCISSCSSSNFPPEVYESRYKSTRLYFAKCEQIYHRLVEGREFDYDGLVVKFDGDYGIRFRDANGEYLGYVENFGRALELYRSYNSTDGGDIATKTLK